MPYRTIRIALLAAASLALAAMDAAAQYRRLPGDTLRYREENETNATLRADEGTFPLTTSQASVVAVTFPRDGEAVAWFDSLAIRSSSIAGDAAPATGAVLGRPYVLRFGPRGYAATVRTPQFPESFAGVSDLAKQFDDFFLPLPAEPLRAGLEWRDSVTSVDSATAGTRGSLTRVGTYRVRGDTTVAGVRGLVVESVVRLHVVTDAGATDERPALRSELLGEERGVAVFDPRGVMLSRRRAAGMTGDVTMGQGPGRRQMQQTIRYRSDLVLLPPLR